MHVKSYFGEKPFLQSKTIQRHLKLLVSLLTIDWISGFIYLVYKQKSSEVFSKMIYYFCIIENH